MRAAPSSGGASGAPAAVGAFERCRLAFHIGIVLFLVGGAGGLLGAASSTTTGSERKGLVLVGVADLAIALALWGLRRARWGQLALLAMVIPALSIYSLDNFVVSDPYLASLYLFVIAVWVGVSQQRGVNAALAPLYALAYWYPLWVHSHGPTFNRSVPQVVIVAVASGETVAWLTNRLSALSDRLRGQDQRRFAVWDQESSDVTMVVDRSANLSHIRGSVISLIGRCAEDLEGSPLSAVLTRLVHADDLALALNTLKLAMGTLWGQEGCQVRLLHVDGTCRHVEVKIRNLLDDDVIEAVLLDVWDVTEQRFLEERLRHQALHDTLTGLANRALLHDRLGRALAACSRQANSVAVLYCDLDAFKAVNSTLGHAAGDRVLIEVASRLAKIVRPADTLARLGADEFAVVLELVDDPDGARTLAERIRTALAEPIRLGESTVRMSASIGIAFGTATMGVDELCRSADTAKSQAKADGKDCYRIFEAAMRSRVQRRLELTKDLRAGIDGSQFRLQYQPHVALPSGELLGFEALVRWDHPRHGMIPPLDFIPLAEESGLIIPIGRWTLETACQEAASWPAVGTRALGLAVNLSVRQLRSASIVDDVRTAVALSGLDPARLVLEITESVLITDPDATIALIGQLKALGVRLAIDDFGTGYSSLSYLHQFTFDVLKIDKSFLDPLRDRPDQSAAFIATIVALGHTLGMQIIAEGIETGSQFDSLAQLGSDAGQGHFISRPLDPAAARAFITHPTTHRSSLVRPAR